MKRILLAAAAVMTLAGAANAEPLSAQDRASIKASVDKAGPRLGQVAKQIWDLAEVGYQEHKSSALLQAELKKAGFKVEAGVAGMPTAFVASFKAGDGPVIGILAEYDALPGLAQAAAPERKPLAGVAGPACGPPVFGAEPDGRNRASTMPSSACRSPRRNST